MPLHKNQLVPLTIDALSNDGNGVGRFEGKAIFVPGTAVGDVLRVRIVKDAKKYAYGRIEQIVTPGPGRIEMDCPIGQSCGGCCFRHLTYEAELAAKHTFVQDALRRIGKIEAPVAAVLPSPEANRYRNKAQYPVAPGPNGTLQYGFYASRSHRIIPCADCLLQPTLLNRIAQRSVELLEALGVTGYDEAAHSGFLRHVYLRQGGHSGQVMVCLVATAPHLPKKEWFVSTLTGEFPQVHTILLNVNAENTNVILGKETHTLYGPGNIQDTLAGVPLALGPHSFSQVNTGGAEQLFAVAIQYAAVGEHDVLLDLYCGAGVIGLSMAAGCRQLIGVEIVPEAVRGATGSAAQMGLSNTRFLCADAAGAAAQLVEEGVRPTVITVDPPRKGCDEATLTAMVAMGPQRIVMVSCNPATLARDLAHLTANGYRVEKVQPVDMFPHTQHVESVALLVKNEQDAHTPTL